MPIEIDAPGAEAVLILAMGNPTPGVARFTFGPLAGAQSASTRIRLAGTQDVVADRQDEGRLVRKSLEQRQGDHRRLRRLRHG